MERDTQLNLNNENNARGIIFEYDKMSRFPPLEMKFQVVRVHFIHLFGIL